MNSDMQSKPVKNKDSALRGIVFSLFGFMIFSVHDAIVKSLGGEFSVFQIMFFAVLFSYVPFSTALAVDKTPRSLRPNNLAWVLLRSFTMVGSAGFAFAAFSMLPLVQAYVLLFLSPLLISLLAIPLLGEKIQIYRSMAIVVGLLGVIIVLRPTADSLQLGHLFGICSAFCNAISAVVSRKIGREENSATMIVYPLLVNVVVTGAATIAFYQPMPLNALLKMFMVGGLGLVAQYSILCAYRSAPAYIVAPFQYSQLVWAVIFGVFFFKEGIDTLTVVGSLVTIASGLMIVWRETKVSVNQPNLRTRNVRTGASPAMKSFENDDGV